MARPKRPEETTKTTFVVPVELLAEVRAFCAARSVGPSRFAERALRELLLRERTGGPEAPWNWERRT